ncbi:zinc-dependent alcohol dehydrogenase family protein [Hoeflea sp. WL0058]|uniref:alcohol dehydrogenase n=1 Tax=Flavimaribacter sediminis TaxID=2865987 RepID=A0AAE2ZGD0_9HYPH|nr:zinc-dependent alcohol dehydrogenase family protein [Flavimaribacter sediminis]MBW8635696.1 zinc-dependent alcohol dehydrogenase family protein [Flavimaribacter sediminis]
MFAMVFDGVGQKLRPETRPIPKPQKGEVLVEVLACAVCRTDLHLIDGELADPKLPVVPGHEIVGRVVALGEGVDNHEISDRIGIPWLGYTCGECHYCLSGRENLCDHARFTGCHIDGGYATHTLADARYCFPLPDNYDDAEAAPLLCAGLIGHRTLSAAGDAQRLGIYGFGAAAHIIAQVAIHEGRKLYAFTRTGDETAQEFATSLGCVWSGGSEEVPPEELEAAMIFAPVGALVPAALKAVEKGGTVVLGGIHMSDIPSMPYSILWGERTIHSIANLTRNDALEFLETAGRVKIETSVTLMPLNQANEALERLRNGEVSGAIVLIP